MDIRQFTAAKAPKSDQQFAVVVAYFYRFEAPEANEGTQQTLNLFWKQHGWPVESDRESSVYVK